MTFSEPVLFTLQAEVQAGLAPHLPDPPVTSLTGGVPNPLGVGAGPGYSEL